MPAGLLVGDEVRIVINAGATGSTAPTITPPGVVSFVATVTWGDGSYTVRHSVYRYRYLASGNPASFAFTHPNAASDGVAIAYSGVDATTPDDVTPTTTSISNTGPAGYVANLNGVTTVTPNALLLVVRGAWDGVAITPPAGYTERLDQPITWVGDSPKATPGATGTITVDDGNNSAGVTPASGIVMALRPATGTSSNTGTLSARAPVTEVSIVGTQTNAGTLSAIAPSGIVDVAGQQANAGRLDAIASPATVSIEGVLRNPGVLDVSAPFIMAMLGGQMMNPGTLSAIAPLAQMSFADSGANRGTLAVMLPTATVSITGVQTNAGVVDATAPLVAMTVSGSQINAGTLNAVVPLVRFAVRPDGAIVTYLGDVPVVLRLGDIAIVAM